MADHEQEMEYCGNCDRYQDARKGGTCVVCGGRTIRAQKMWDDRLGRNRPETHEEVRTRWKRTYGR